MSILSKLIPGSTANIISRDLKRLNDVQAGLGDAAARYVLKGDGETVLSTLSVAVTGEPLGICTSRTYGDKDHIPEKRQALFLDSNPLDLPLVARYAQVLAASCTPLPERVLGSDKGPAAMRIFFSEAFLGTMDPATGWYGGPRKTPIKGLTPDKLVPAAQALGGTLEDLFEILFWESSTYYMVRSEYFRALSDLKPIVQAHGAAAIAGASRAPAPGRAAFLTALGTWGLVQEAPFLSATLDCAGDSAKSVRDAALKSLHTVPAKDIETIALDRLAKGTVSVRAGMVTLLVGLDTTSGNEGLIAHAKVEKTARIKAAIENALSVSDATSETNHASDDASGYTALDGSRVDIPALRPLATGAVVPLSEVDRQRLRDDITAHNAQADAWNRENKTRKYFFKETILKMSLVEVAERLLTGQALPNDNLREASTLLRQGLPIDVLRAHLAKMPQEQALAAAFRSLHTVSYWLNPWNDGAFSAVLLDYLASPDADLRAVDQLWQDLQVEIRYGVWPNTGVRKAKRGDVLRVMIPNDPYWDTDPRDIQSGALWPYLAENLDVLDHAFGLGKGEDTPLGRVHAVACLAAMPKVPMRYFGPLLDIATGERKSGKAEARLLLNDVVQVEDRLVTLLDDTRQAVRAGAAEWMGTRGNSSAIKPLKQRLKKEKSELPKAAILTALQQLGEPLDSYVGPTVLMREAEAGLKRAKLDKINWLAFDALPALAFKSGKPVPMEVPTWWMYLAFKLKQPGGNALFDIYLNQLKPEDAETLSQWVLDSWISYDIERPSDDEANAYAEQNVDARYKALKPYLPDYTRERVFADLRREKLSDYFNSGAATKGLLAFAARTPAQIAADRVRAYLRNHGSRISQASSLLDMLANKGDPVSLQVVISAATRLKQKGVQAYAGTLVQDVADRMNWSLDELGDRVIPTAGLDDAGHLDLPCGADARLYRATLSETLSFVLQNPDGKVVKSLPSGDDDATKAAKKQFTASKKELKQVISMQTGRLYEALCSARQWAVADWQRDFRDHPLMRRLTERVVWQGLDAEGTVLANFRPTAEGDYTDAEDAPVTPEDFDAVRLAHGAMMDPAQADLWHTHLTDYEVTPLFTQFGRTLLRLDPSQSDATLIEDRKGWVLENFQLRGVASKLGYERGPAEDGGWFFEYRKGFSGVGLTAVVAFTGSFLPEENQPVALISLAFEKDAKRMRHTIKLGDVPEVLLSECWNDFHAMAVKGAFDPAWEKVQQW